MNQPTPSRILAVAEYGYSLRFVDPPVGVEWCRVAADVSTAELDPSMRARVLGYFANSLRLVGKYDDANEVLALALKIFLVSHFFLNSRRPFYETSAKLNKQQKTCEMPLEYSRLPVT